MSDTETQNRQILKALKGGLKITALYALNEFGCFRLSARIGELKEAGHDIKDRWIRTSTNKRVKEYYLEA
jgi:hypothetical protein